MHCSFAIKWCLKISKSESFVRQGSWQKHKDHIVHVNLMLGPQCHIVHRFSHNARVDFLKMVGWRQSKKHSAHFDVLYEMWCLKLVLIFDHWQPHKPIIKEVVEQLGPTNACSKMPWSTSGRNFWHQQSSRSSMGDPFGLRWTNSWIINHHIGDTQK